LFHRDGTKVGEGWVVFMLVRTGHFPDMLNREHGSPVR